MKGEEDCSMKITGDGDAKKAVCEDVSLTYHEAHQRLEAAHTY